MTSKALPQRVASRGLLKTLLRLPHIARNTWYHWIDTSLDRKYGIDTQGIIDDMAALNAPESARAHANGYEGIQIPVFKRILKTLPLDPREYVFIDFGSGKGRACIMAAKWGFANVIGVEFSPVLHSIAQHNVDIFQRHRAADRSGNIELHLQDATAFSIPDGKIVCFFYNPFDATVLQKVLSNLKRAFQTYQQPIWIIYRNAVHAPLFDNDTDIRLLHADRDYNLYRIAQS